MKQRASALLEQAHTAAVREIEAAAADLIRERDDIVQIVDLGMGAVPMVVYTNGNYGFCDDDEDLWPLEQKCVELAETFRSGVGFDVRRDNLPEPESFAKFAKDHGLKIDDAKPIPSDDDKFIMWHVRVVTKYGHVFFDNKFGTGLGYVVPWARSGIGTLRVLVSRMDNPQRPRTVYDVGIFEDLKQRYHRAAPINLEELLEIVQLECSHWEETFEEWCSSIGENPDSRKAEGIYHAQQTMAKQARAAIGHDEFERFLEIEA
ncbi:hypothetical protein P1J78_22850 [Psychromarinibacter sp. C21-152]|uniref:Uncharacterized protein n=1 Tax=Psychromarinibacter sediminicola TaxID=3033385 RepID=A0AAE3NSQ7_9RHOB|nr:hypothetical protein [Psychromarinibacter sediminicola]MDF0603573.1 hypothetical protein [Psychromarinibacter sediminicola]